MGVNVWSLAWAGLLLGIGWASGACLPMGEGQVFLLGGDVVLTELLPLHSGRDCSKLGLTEVQIMEATRLAVQKVNELELIPGVTLGLRVVDTCGKTERSVKMALASLADDTRDCINPAVSLGFLGPGDGFRCCEVAAVACIGGVDNGSFGLSRCMSGDQRTSGRWDQVNERGPHGGRRGRDPHAALHHGR
ncbi:metabotropic glutamate receptor 6-like [Penaeus monodon]|uniref:metabotropic glutamate receptor 6-like n=1 Tax=Penaeus monodon TaxID=6687 RepID=UPI0018A6F81C|nr:metabotropic glutamate receptor 6-like [Penaeus monodon]